MKKLKPLFKFKIGKCYRITTNSKHVYRIKVRRINYDLSISGPYRYRFEPKKRYGQEHVCGCFSFITKAVEIPSL